MLRLLRHDLRLLLRDRLALLVTVAVMALALGRSRTSTRV